MQRANTQNAERRLPPLVWRGLGARLKHAHIYATVNYRYFVAKTSIALLENNFTVVIGNGHHQRRVRHLFGQHMAVAMQIRAVSRKAIWNTGQPVNDIGRGRGMAGKMRMNMMAYQYSKMGVTVKTFNTPEQGLGWLTGDL